MRSIFQFKIFRWIFPVFFTVIALLLSLHKSPEPVVLSRYNYHYFVFLLSTVGLAAQCWWIALNQHWYLRLAHRLLTLPLISLVIVCLGLAGFFDLFIDLIMVIAILPLLLALFLGLLAIPKNFSNFGRNLRGAISPETVRIWALVILSLYAGLVIVEVIFRNLFLEPKVPATEQQFYDLIASSWPRNISIEKPSGSFRIVALSDSFGRFGGDNNFHYLLESLLHQAGYNQVEVINISAVDYSPFDELEVLKRFGARYSPDLVLHGFYIGNDLGVPDTKIMVYQNIGARMAQGSMAYRPRNLLVIQWLRSFSKVQVDNFRQAWETENASAAPRTIMSRHGFLNIQRRFLDNYRLEPVPAKRWSGTIKNLNAIQAEADKLGAAYLLVIHPDQIQTDPDLKQTLEATFNLNLATAYDLELPQTFLTDYCQTHNIYCLNLLDAFSAAGQPLYQANDIHYNQAGNRLAALTIFEYLERHKLIQN